MENKTKHYNEGELSPKQIGEIKQEFLTACPIQPRDIVQHVSGGPIMSVVDITVVDDKNYHTKEVTLSIILHTQYFNKNRQEFTKNQFNINALNIVKEDGK